MSMLTILPSALPDVCSRNIRRQFDPNGPRATRQGSAGQSAARLRQTATTLGGSRACLAGPEPPTSFEGRRAARVLGRCQVFSQHRYRNRPRPEDCQQGQGPIPWDIQACSQGSHRGDSVQVDDRRRISWDVPLTDGQQRTLAYHEDRRSASSALGPLCLNSIASRHSRLRRNLATTRLHSPAALDQ
jgi:hypothetical protein